VTLRQTIHRHWRNLPFAQKLAGLFIALVSLPIIVVVLYTNYTSQEALIAGTRVRNLERAQATAAVIEAFFADARADVRVASALSTVVDLCEQPDVASRYDRAMRSLHALRTEQRVLAVYVTDRSGRVLAATDGRAPLGSLQIGRAFLTAIAGETVVDEADYDPFDGRVAMRVSNAVRSEAGEIIGTATALVDVSALDVLTREDDNFGGHGEFGVLWTGVGVRLSHSTDNAERFAPWTELPPDSRVSLQQRLGPAFPGSVTFDEGFAPVADRGQWLLYDAGSDPHVRVESRRLGPLQVTMVPLRGQRWVYGIFVPEGRLLAALRTQMLRDWAVAFFTVLAALALSVIAARWVTQPLTVVTETANALASGDMRRRVRLNRKDEIGQLGGAFDAMAAALEDKERQLQAHASTLERRVAERTATLQLLERASRTLASSLELRRTAVNLATLLVPGSADFCSIDIRDLNGNLRRVACRHADPVREQTANELADVRPVRDPASTLSADERELLNLTDVRVYELSAGRQFVGQMTVAMASPARSFQENDELVFEELGRRAGLALANALLYQEAQDANRLKDEFLGVVSHELRTPLNAIMGWTRLAGVSREAGINPHKALEAVERNARALARLVDDLLDVPRIMMGKLALDLRPVDLVAIVNAAVDAIRPGAAAKSLDVEVHSDVAAAVIEGDAHRLQQVFGNLLSNALKFTAGGGRITIRLRHAAESYEVAVEDTGAGIRKDFLPFVFDRFRQADSSTSRAHGGLGIGLSLVRHLVEMHGGQVTAFSDGPGCGSVFTVRLPVTSANPDAEAAEQPSPEVAARDRLRDMRLLVVDDDRDSREVAARMLEAIGASVRVAASVADAMSLLRQNPTDVDAVLADIGMPGEDGYAFIHALRETPDVRVRSLPVVAVTAYASRSDRARALAAGFDAHVAKPVSVSALVEALDIATTQRTR
jgi:signal transduction histidine kinase/ActR/RegA family two-component response regulator/HAMP domain-containing protein